MHANQGKLRAVDEGLARSPLSSRPTSKQPWTNLPAGCQRAHCGQRVGPRHARQASLGCAWLRSRPAAAFDLRCACWPALGQVGSEERFRRSHQGTGEFKKGKGKSRCLHSRASLKTHVRFRLRLEAFSGLGQVFRMPLRLRACPSRQAKLERFQPSLDRLATLWSKEGVETAASVPSPGGRSALTRCRHPLAGKLFCEIRRCLPALRSSLSVLRYSVYRERLEGGQT